MEDITIASFSTFSTVLTEMLSRAPLRPSILLKTHVSPTRTPGPSTLCGGDCAMAGATPADSVKSSANIVLCIGIGVRTFP